MSGQLERCEREWHELEGEFQELQVRPGHLAPPLGYLGCSTFPFLLPQPGWWAPSGPRGGPGPALEAGGPHGPAPSHLPALQFFHLGRPGKASIPPPLHRRFALSTSVAAESWSVASEGKFQACPCGGGLRGQVYAGTQREQPSPHLLRGLPYPHPSALGRSTAPLSWGSSPPLQLC